MQVVASVTLVFGDDGNAPFGGCGIEPERDTIVRFCLKKGSPLCLLSPRLMTNFPTQDKPFDREQFNLVQTMTYNGDKDWSVDLLLNHPGTFDYYLAWDDGQGSIGHFVINPRLQLNGKILNVPGISMQTHLTKLMGPLDTWKSHFSLASQLGYNMIHFTPIQELGESRSAYSLYDHNMISNGLFPNQQLSEDEKILRVKEFFADAEEMGILTLGDVVLNHTASNTPWVADHPEALYTIDNCPHLRPALDLDLAVQQLSEDIVDGKYVEKYQLAGIQSGEDLPKLHDVFHKEVLPKLKLWEYFVIDVESTLGKFRNHEPNHNNQKNYDRYAHVDPSQVEHLVFEEALEKHEGKRNQLSLNVPIVEALFAKFPFHERATILKEFIERFNLRAYETLNRNMEVAGNAIVGTADWEHLQQKRPLNKEFPLVWAYFRPIKKDGQILTYAACNGWVGQQTINFASPESQAYLRREVVIWGDCLKLRFGEQPSDSPWLWNYMKKYMETTATLFHGVRLDNCHGTPLHVARYLIDVLRSIRPEVYVLAELFTESTDQERLYISKLGINSLLREGDKSGGPDGLGNFCYMYGGDQPVGSMSKYYPASFYSPVHNKAHVERDLPELTPRLPPAVFYDCTHDNEAPPSLRDPRDSLSLACLIAMTKCAIGTTRGYDELYPERVDLVAETKFYPQIPESKIDDVGIMRARATLNRIHQRLDQDGFIEQHVHQVSDIITIQRHNPITHYQLCATCRTAHGKENGSDEKIVTIRLPGQIRKIIGCYILKMKDNNNYHKDSHESETLTGLQSVLEFYGEEDPELQDIFSHHIVDQDSVEAGEEIRLKHFPPGSILLYETSLPDKGRAAMEVLTNLDQKSIYDCFQGLTCIDFNYLFYVCDQEEKADTEGKHGCYGIPGIEIPYAGIVGIISHLEGIRKTNHLGHPLCDNLRKGNWLFEYIVERIKRREKANFKPLIEFLTHYFHQLTLIPRHFIPMYFDKIVMKYYLSGCHYISSQLSPFIATSQDQFVHNLALTSVQMFQALRNQPLIETKKNGQSFPVSMAAGLPHFSSGFMRTWGRDTFISLRGLLLTTGRLEEAEQTLLGFASSVRHGLIPNLLDCGRNPRYNARDATWWFMQALQDYCKIAPNGIEILQKKVMRLFPWDHYYGLGPIQSKESNTVAEIVQEIMQKHVKGINFRERDAGPKVDEKMQNEGFNIESRFDHFTGFLVGGNEFNCGTWMDKMGDSKKAHNFGVPATPRDGAAIEIIGLVKSATKWLSQISVDPKVFPHKFVLVYGLNPKYPGEGVPLTYYQWDAVLRTFFEQKFYIPQDPSQDHRYDLNHDWIHRRGIYKDTHGSKQGWSDYQLRPNQCIAMAVAPELFDPNHARAALNQIEQALLGPLGMRTLDPHDKRYAPHYDNGSDTDDFFTSKGMNYHQGPEWVWPLGFFLRAKIQFSPHSEKTQLTNTIHNILKKHRQYIKESVWRGLPELTNKDGATCSDSCPTQAWSGATILDALYDLSQNQKASPVPRDRRDSHPIAPS